MKLIKKIGLFLLLISSSVVVFSQRTNYESPYLQKESYIPRPGTNKEIKKTIHIAFHIWQRADGSGNFQDNYETKERFNTIVAWMNDNYNKVSEEIIPALPYRVDYIRESNIYFQLEGIYYYKDASIDSSYCYTTKYAHNKKLNDFLKKNYPERTKTLNIHIFRGHYIGAAGYSTGGSIGKFYSDDPDFATSTKGDFFLSNHWAHEVGHGLDLWHTYDRNTTYQQNCNPNYKDFLYDLYDTTKLDKSKDCEAELLKNYSSNNLMGGAQKARGITPSQMGIMHRATVLENLYNKGFNMRDYVTGYSFTPMQIKQDETWDVSMKIYQDIVITAGKTLTITQEIQMVPQAKIIVEKGAKLIVDGAVITYENYYQKKWQGVILRKGTPKTSIPNGEIIYRNGGKILNAKKIK